MKIYSWPLAECDITFADEAAMDLTRRGLDPNDPNNWVITSKFLPVSHVSPQNCTPCSNLMGTNPIVTDVTLSEGWKKTAFYPDGTPFLENEENNADGPVSASSPESMITAAPDAELAEKNIHISHLLRHAHGVSHA